MKTERLLELQKTRGEHLDKISNMLEKCDTESRNFTTEEKADFDSLEQTVQDLNGQIEREQRGADMLKDAKPVAENNATLDMNANEEKQYSFKRLIAALADPQNKRAQADAAFEFECHNALVDQRGEVIHEGSSGIQIPHNVLKRTLTTGANAGGEFVETEVEKDFISLLRSNLVIEKMGARMLTDLNGNVDIPSITAGSTATWLATEETDTSNSEPTTGAVQLRPKSVGVYVDLGRNLIKQSSNDVEGWIRSELAEAVAEAIDIAAIEGSGAGGQPTGIKNTGSIGSVTFGAADPTFAEIVALETAVAAANGDRGNLGYLMDATMRGALKTTEKASGTGQFVWENGNTVNGYATGVSNNVTDGDVFFGNFNDLVLAMWGGLSLIVDPYSLSRRGGVRVVAIQTVDVGVRRAGSFALGNDGV